MKKFARKCDGTEKGMNKGYVVFDGELHFATKEHLINYLRTLDWEDCDGNRSEDVEDDEDLLDYFYREDAYYYTEWEDEDDFEWIEDKNGNLIEL